MKKDGKCKYCTDGCFSCDSRYAQSITPQNWIETWKLDLERLLWSYHENGRPDGKTGVIGNPRTIEQFVSNLIAESISGERERIVNEVKKITLRNSNEHAQFTNIHVWANEMADFISTLTKESNDK